MQNYIKFHKVDVIYSFHSQYNLFSMMFFDFYSTQIKSIEGIVL